ncbi:MAG TPA: exodeoxyribonuclease VII small subunit [Planctomycetaceae bacterium]|jgi:exodeoxyribonuclease VII small subunit|nr:exodeoxyribonuclease VII small subunit [Planctomycetaceae bacterium]
MSDNSAPESLPTFEAALEQLQTIVHELEEGQLGLETSLTRFETGVRLLRNCYQILEQAEQRIEVLTGVDSQGNPIVGPFDATATIESADKGLKKPGRRRGAPKPAAASEPEPEAAEPDEQRLF